ncbi:hypothetical protein [Thalassobaculum sp.]|uniref:hypothetical protein n=1 Tax=Thalassobaculum sp. TaxID=2022740 RepID=UPI0032EC60CA
MEDDLDISNKAKALEWPYISSDDLATLPDALRAREVTDFIELWITEGVPASFKTKPFAFQVLRNRFKENIGVKSGTMSIAGSGRFGFSLSPKRYGQEFDTARSDLDFFLIEQGVFGRLSTEFKNWKRLYEERKISPLENAETIYWPENKERGSDQIRRGFIDTKFIPNRQDFPFKMKIADAEYKAGQDAKRIHPFEIEKVVSLRVYRDVDAFKQQISINLRALRYETTNR